MNEFNIVFADASFYIAAFNIRDESHQTAVGWQGVILSSSSRVVTTEAVLWEWLNYYSAPPARQIALRHYAALHADPLVEIVGFEPDLVREAISFYASHSDKSWGVTDCLSFLIMRRFGILAALTTDHHFEQAGFKSLLLRPPV